MTATANPSGFPQTVAGGTPAAAMSPVQAQVLDPQTLAQLQAQSQPQQAAPATTASSFPRDVDPSLAMQGQQMQANQPPTPTPILQTLIQGMRNPSQVGSGSRTQVFENFLGNFLGAMGQGFANEGTGPGSGFRGAGAAMGAPYQQAVNQWQMNMAGQKQAADIAEQQARAGQIGAQTQMMRTNVPITMPNGQVVYVPQTQAGSLLAGAQKGQYGLQQAQAAKRFVAVPNVGLFDTQAEGGPKLVPGSDAGSATVTPELLQDYPNIPQEWLGRKIPLQAVPQFGRALSSQMSVVGGATDQYAVNKVTGQTRGLGIGTPAQASAMFRPVPVTDPVSGLTTYMSAAQAVRGGFIAPNSDLQKNAFVPGARFKDIDRVVAAVNSSVPSLDKFSDGQQALISKALSDPSASDLGALHAFVGSKLYKQMGAPARDYVNSVLSLREQIMGVNAMLTGVAGVTDSRIQAIWNTLPNVEPDSDAAQRKMVLVRGMIENLKDAFPEVRAMQNIPGAGTGAIPPQGGAGPMKPTRIPKPTANFDPTTHSFDAAVWAKANPKKDVNAAIAKAKAQGYKIVNAPTR